MTWTGIRTSFLAGMLTETAAPPAVSTPSRRQRARLPDPVIADAFRVAGTAPLQPLPGQASVIVATHNDAANLPQLLTGLLREQSVGEVIVVASACTDDTLSVVVEHSVRDPRIHLFVEFERSGKMAAINQGLQIAVCDEVVVVSGDVLPEPGAIDALVARLRQPGVGMVGGRPVPVNAEGSFTGHLVHLLWRLHHRLALHVAKIGEIAAIRAEALAALLPPTAVDEACLQAVIAQHGWEIVYEPAALIRNRAPATIRDFVAQRRRIHGGHLALRTTYHYTVPSLRPLLLARELLRDLAADCRRLRPRRVLRTVGAVAIEAYARLLARADHVLGRKRHVWEMVPSAKDPAAGPHGRSTGVGEPVA